MTWVYRGFGFGVGLLFGVYCAAVVLRLAAGPGWLAALTGLL